MRITTLAIKPGVYSSNVYLVRGDFNKLGDKNVLIDTGGDGSIIEQINNINTGAGKKKLDYVLLTHSHFDHTGAIKEIRKNFKPIIYAWRVNEYSDRGLKDNQIFKIGDKQMRVLYTPGHSNDSICIYGWEDKILFSGDTQLDIHTSLGTYSQDFVNVLIMLAGLEIHIIYPGHGLAVYNAAAVIKRSLLHVQESVSKNGYCQKSD